ncbi:hypothetical protein J3F84DRAFT_357024 [Trichoderma pleuroticola]
MRATISGSSVSMQLFQRQGRISRCFNLKHFNPTLGPHQSPVSSLRLRCIYRQDSGA